MRAIKNLRVRRVALKGRFQRAAVDGNAATGITVNGLMRAAEAFRRKPTAGSVIKAACMIVHCREDVPAETDVNLGGTAGSQSCPKEG